MTGRNHAGENLEEVLKARASGLAPPMQMCDALSRNVPKELKTILTNCLVHARRHFVDIVEAFPQECQYVIELLSEIYRNEATLRDQGLNADERLAFHQKESGPIMDQLKSWCEDQFEQKLVEPNSGLGKAIQYLRNHWEELTRFLHVPKAPLDNNVCERALKLAVRHRSNALFFKTQHGAHVGDIFMSLIHTCQLAGENPFDYLMALMRHANKLADSPERWFPWSYRTTLKAI
jgi:transposase